MELFPKIIILRACPYPHFPVRLAAGHSSLRRTLLEKVQVSDRSASSSTSTGFHIRNIKLAAIISLSLPCTSAPLSHPESLAASQRTSPFPFTSSSPAFESLGSSICPLFLRTSPADQLSAMSATLVRAPGRLLLRARPSTRISGLNSRLPNSFRIPTLSALSRCYASGSKCFQKILREPTPS